MKNQVIEWINENSLLLTDVARKIWAKPELPFAENYASALQSTVLKEHGFTVTPVKNVPTAFVAEYGHRHPVIGILGEYDALAGLSNQVSSRQEPVDPGAPGHGCGHNLLGTAGAQASH